MTHLSPKFPPDRRSVAQALIRSALFLVMPLLPIGRLAFGQALPAAEAAPISTGFELPRTAGTLSYSIGANESLSTGYYSSSGLDSSTGINGNLAFITSSKVSPTSMVFSGGRSWSTSGQPSTLYLNLGLSQVYSTRLWNFVISDSVNYLPQTPSTGLSGIPGAGDLGVPPVQVGADTGQGILTPYATRVNNSAALSVQRNLTASTALQTSGSYTILRFVGNSNGGVETNGASGTAGLTHRIDARNSINGNYTYTQYSYGATQPGFISQTASIGFSRQFSRLLSVNVSAGPQRTTSTNTSQSIPSSLSLYASAGLSYVAQYASLTLGYSRSTNSGYGVVEGARSDSINFGASHSFARVWNGSVSSSYTRTTSLASSSSPAFAPQTLVEGVQLSRAIVRSISAFASYTLENQSTPGSTAAISVFSGHFQTVGFGLTFSPTPIHFGPR